MGEREFNDLYYVCSLLESMSRKTKNRRSFTAQQVGLDGIRHLYEYADVFHCMTMEESTDEAVELYHVPTGDYDTVSLCEYKVPSVTSIGRVYARLVRATRTQEETIPEGIYRVFTSFISDEISDYNSAVYYSSPDYLKQSLLAGCLLD